MNADLEHLVVLQAIDLDAKRLREELGVLPGRLGKAQDAQKLSNATLQGALSALRTEEGLRRRQESDAEDHRTRLVRLRRQLETATSAAQVTALQHEIDFAQAAIRSLEDEEFASMERTETLGAQQASAEKALQVATATAEAERTRNGELTRAHTAALAGLDAERKLLRPLIAESLLATFDRVSRARGTGLAEAREGQCTACRMKVRPQRWADLASREHEDEIFTCESCGRILFHDPRRNTPGPWVAGDRLSAALRALEPASARSAAPLAAHLSSSPEARA